MRCTYDRVFGPIYLGEAPLSLEYGGVACLKGNRFILASKYSPDLYLVDGNIVVSSCKVPCEAGAADYECCGIAVPDTQSEIFVLTRSLSRGLLQVFRVMLIGDEMYQIHASALYLPQTISDAPNLAYSEITWDRDGLFTKFTPTPFAAGGLFLNYYPNIPLGIVSTYYKPYISCWMNKLIIGINHVQYVRVYQKHNVPHINDTIFKTWITPVKTIQYTQNNWWKYTRQVEAIQEDKICTDTMECPICGCSTRCTCNRHVPLWNEDGSPKMLNALIDKIQTNILLRYPALISSLVVLDYQTGLIEGITHIGSSSFGVSESYAPRMFITGLAVEGDTVWVSLSRLTKSIPREYLAWGDTPYTLPVSTANTTPTHPVQTFLDWWGTHHLPVIKESRLQGEPVVPVCLTSFPVSTLRHGSISAKLDYTTSALALPFSHPTTVMDVDFSSKDNAVYAVTTQGIFKYLAVHHEFVTATGAGTDLYIGQVIKNVEKVVVVTMRNLHATATLGGITLTRVADNLQPYYQYVQLSSDGGTTWNASISLGNIAPGSSKTFHVRLNCDSTKRIPKPVSLDTQYIVIYT